MVLVQIISKIIFLVLVSDFCFLFCEAIKVACRRLTFGTSSIAITAILAVIGVNWLNDCDGSGLLGRGFNSLNDFTG